MSSRITIFAGRFGSGKTEVALNYTLQLAEQGLSPLLIDLDIVTPYFRTREKADEMAQHGVEVVTPFPVGQHIHVPAISPRILGAIEQSARPVVIDLGGDEQGSRAVAQYATAIARLGYAMNSVVNPYRPFMDTVAGIETAIQEIEDSSQGCPSKVCTEGTGRKLAVSALVSNPNLMSETSNELFLRGHRLIQKAGRVLRLPIAFAVVDESLSETVDRSALHSPLLVIHRFFPMFDTV